MEDKSKPKKYEYSKKIKYMETELEIIFKIDSNCDLEVLCICENGLTFASKKFNIKNSNLDYKLFSDLIKLDENLTLEGDFSKDNFTIKLFKNIKLELSPKVDTEKIISYLCKKVENLSKELTELKNTKVIPLTLLNGWANYDYGYAPGKIIKKGNEITLSGLIKGTNFSTICTLP